jgi:hypothetical protein
LNPIKRVYPAIVIVGQEAVVEFAPESCVEPEPSVVARRHDPSVAAPCAVVSPFTVGRSPSARGKGVVARNAIGA